MKPVYLLALCLLTFPGAAFAAAPYSVQPPSEISVPYQIGGTSPLGVAMPPQVPPYLPNGAINLDYVWTQDGGARLYWNTVLIPQELKMGGATWQDPALVPQLFPPQQAVRRPVTTRRAVSRPVAKAPANAGTTALRVPATRKVANPTSAKSGIPPLRAPGAHQAVASPAVEDAGPMPDPPRLQ